MANERADTSAAKGDPKAVEGLLANLRRRCAGKPAPTPLPDVAEAPRQLAIDADLRAQFRSAAEGVGAHVHETDRAGWVALVCELAKSDGVRQVCLSAVEGGFFDVAQADELTAALERAGVTVHRPATSPPGANLESSDAELFDADAGITGVFAAIAETGTVVCCSGAAQPRATSLVPPRHYAIVGAEQILPDLVDLLPRLTAAGVPTNVNLITGPSKTADIEGVLVTGVHGPGLVRVVVVA